MTYRTELVQVAAVCLAAAQDAACGTTALKHSKEGQRGFAELTTLLNEVREERLNQELRFGTQIRPRRDWLVILLEEVGEVAEEIVNSNPGYYGDDPFVCAAIQLGRQAREELEAQDESAADARPTGGSAGGGSPLIRQAS